MEALPNLLWEVEVSPNLPWEVEDSPNHPWEVEVLPNLPWEMEELEDLTPSPWVAEGLSLLLEDGLGATSAPP